MRWLDCVGIGCVMLIASSCATVDACEAPHVSHEVRTIRQPTTMSCWAAVTTMLLSWHAGDRPSIEETIERLGEPWITFYRTDSGLPAEMQLALVHKLGLEMEAPANYTMPAYREFLAAYGPLWVITGDGMSSHAQLLVAIAGDGTYANTCIEFIDPSDGRRHTETGLAFAQRFEADARALVTWRWDETPLRWQIIHLPAGRTPQPRGVHRH